MREASNPSWFNPVEAVQVMSVVGAVHNAVCVNNMLASLCLCSVIFYGRKVLPT